MTPFTLSDAMSFSSFALSAANFLRWIRVAGLAIVQPESHSAVPIVFVPTSRPSSRQLSGSAARNSAVLVAIIA